MSVDSKEIELIIRANNQSKQTLDGVARSISELNALIDQQAAASKRGAVGIDELKATVLQLQQAQEKLKSQATLISQFERSGEAAEKAAARVERAKAAYDKYSASDKDYEKDGSITEKRAAQLAKLETAVTRAEAAQARRIATNEKLAAQLREQGISTENLVGAEDRLRQSAAELGLSIGRASTNVAEFTTNLKAARQAEKELAETEAFKRQSEEAARLVKASEYVNWWAESLNKAEQAQKEQAATDAFNRQAAEAAKLVKAGEYVAFWADALQRKDAVEQAAANKAAASKLASEAEQAARGFTTLAASAGDAIPKVTGLFDTIRGIADPAAVARQSIAGLEAEAGKLAAAVDAINGPVKGYRDTMASLEAVQKGVAQQAGAIDAYRQQMLAVQAARQAFVQARAEVTTLAAAMRAADAPSQELNTQMRAAQSALSSAANAMRNTLNAARDMRTALQGAGIDTANLAGAEQRLISVTQSNTSTIRNLTAAYQEHGAASENAASKFRLFGEGGRTTLSLFQRLRGEVLSLTASYVGLLAAVNGVKGVLEATVEKQAIQNRIGVVVGTDPKKVGDEYAYVHDQAVRLGIGMKELAGSYSKFAIDAKGTNMSLDNTKFVFERLTEAMRVNHASSEAINGAFMQFGQMLAKGKVQMDDLKQAANWLPGLRTSMAKGLAEIGYEGVGKQNPVGDMLALMKKGGVDAGVALHAVALQMQKDYAEQLPEALRSLQAEQGRFSTIVFDFKNMVSDAGFGKAYTEFLNNLNEKMSSDKGGEFAKKLSEALVKLLDLLTTVLDNIGLIGDALLMVFAVKGATALSSFIAYFPILVTKIKEGTAALNAMSGVLGFLQSGLLLLTAAFVGWQIGSILYEKFAFVRFLGAEMVKDLLIGWEYIKAAAEVAWEGIKVAFNNGFAGIVNTFTSTVQGLLGIAKRMAEAAGATDTASAIGRGIESLNGKIVHMEDLASKVKKIWADMGTEVDKIKKTVGEMQDDIIASETGGKPNKPKPAPNVTGAPDSPLPVPKSGVDEKAAEKRAKLIQTITDEIAQLQAQVNRRETDSIEAQMAVFDAKATAIVSKIRRVGGAEAERFSAQVADLIGKLKKQAEQKYMDELDAMHGQTMDKVNKATDTMAKGYDQLVKARLDAVRKQFRQAAEEIDAYEAKLKGSAKAGQPVPADKMAEVTAWREQLAAHKDIAEQQAREKAAEEALAERAKEVNLVVAERKHLLEIVQLAEEAGLITGAESQRQQKAIIDQMQPKIERMARDAMTYARAMGSALKPGQLQEFQARMVLVEKSGQGAAKQLYSAKQANDDLASGMTSTLKGMAEGLAGVVTGANGLAGAFQGAGRAFLKFAADFLMKIAEMIIKQQILNLLQSSGMASGGGIGAAIAAAVGAAAQAHSGAVVGSAGNPGATRAAPAAWFDNAPRYHTGGIVGLQPDEYPAILKKNEEVLTADSPRNVLNGGTTAGGGAQPAVQDVTINNHVDAASFMSAALAKPNGQKMIMNVLSANRAQLKTLVGR